MTDFTDARLGALLADVGAHVTQPTSSCADRVAARCTPRHRSISHHWLVAAAAVLVVALAVTAVAPARDAIANLLGLGNTSVQHVDELPASAPTTLPAARGSDAQLRGELRRAGLSAPSRRVVGDPIAWNIDAAGETVVVWLAAALSQNRTTDAGVAMKLVPRDVGVVATTVNGQEALWVPGRHVRTVDGTNFSADSALLWVANSTMYRLETSRLLAAARSMAESVAPVR